MPEVTTPATTPAAAPTPTPAALDLLVGGSPASRAGLPALPPGSTVTVGGTTTVPATIIDTAELADAVTSASAEVRVPLTAGARIRGDFLGLTVPFEVRGDTELVVRVEVAAGKIDWQKSRLWFEVKGKDGQKTSLDGPLWLNPRALYVRATKGPGGVVERTLRVDLPWCPDVDVTALVLGPAARSVPETPAQLVRLLAAEGSIPRQVGTGGARVDLGTGDVTGLPGPTTTTAPPKRLVQDLVGAVDFGGLRVRLAGEARPGRLALGGGTIDLAPGSRLRATGRPADLRVELEASVRGLELVGEGTRFTTGAGTLRLAVGASVPVTAGGVLAGKPRLGVIVRELSVRDAELWTPAGVASAPDAVHHLRFDELRAASTPGADATVLWEAGDAAHPARLALALPEAHVTGLSGRVVARGADGQPAALDLGPGGALTARVALDTADQSFALDAHLANVDARVGAVALAESKGLDLELSAASLEGSARLRVARRGSVATLDVEPDPGTAIVARAGVRHAVIGDAHDPTKPLVELGPDSGAVVRLTRLHLGGGDAPVFHGSGELRVTLHALHVPLGGDLGVELQEGSTGTLTIHDMGRAEGDPSPSLRATLRLDLGVHAVVAPGVPGIPGLKLTVDTDTGHTLLELEASLDRDGTLRCDAGIVIAAAVVHGSVVAADGAHAPAVVLPPDPLALAGPLALAPVRSPAPARVLGPTPPAAVAVAPPRLELDPVQVVAALQDGRLDARIPLLPFSARLTELDATGSVLDDKVGVDVVISAANGTALATAGFAVQAGRLVAGSRLTLTPPVRLRFDATLFEPGPGTASGAYEAELRGARLVVDPRTGRGWLEPELWLPTPLPSRLEARVNAWVNETAGKLVTGWLLGDETVPLDAADFTRRLTSRGSSPASAGDLRRYVRVEDVAVGLTVTRVAPLRLGLGHGQWIALGGRNDLAVRGTLDDFTLEANTELAGLEVGNPTLGVKVGASRGHVKLHVRRVAGAATPEIDLEVTGLATQGLALDVRSGDVQASVRDGALASGTLRVHARPGAAPELDADLRGLAARLSANGGTDAGAGAVEAAFAGSLSLHGGALAADVERLDLSARGLSGARTTGAELAAHGAAKVTLSAGGVLALEQRGGDRLTVSAGAELADGSRVRLSGASARRLELGFARGLSVTADDVVADLDAVVRLPGGVVGSNTPASVLDLRRAHVRGGLELSPTGLSARRGLTVTGLDASLTHVALPPLPYGRVTLEQLDVSGDARVVIAKNGAVSVERVSGGKALRAQARTHGASLGFDRPDLELVLGDASVRFDLAGLAMGPGVPASVALEHAALDGVVASGRLRVHDEPARVKVLEIDRRARVHLEVPSLTTGRFAGKDARAVATRAVVRIEGSVRTAVAVGEPGQNSLAGTFRLIGSVVGDTARGFASESEMTVSGDARVQLEQHLGRTRADALAGRRRLSIRSSEPARGPRAGLAARAEATRQD